MSAIGYTSDLPWAPMPDQITAEQYAAASKAVDRNAHDETEAAMFRDLLGIEVA